MGSRAPIALWIFVAVAFVGCGDDSTGYGGSDMSTAGAHDMGMAGCAVVTVFATDDLGVKKMTVPARLTASVPASGYIGPHWTLTRSGDTTNLPVTMTDSGGFTVEYDATLPGTYTFTVRFDKPGCTGTNNATLDNPTGVPVLYRFRALPPETSGFQLTDTTVQIIGGTSRSADLTLDAGTPVTGVLRAGGVATAGEVRLIADDGPDADALTDGGGNFALAMRPSGMYTPLLIPKSTSLAPHLGAKAPGASFIGASFTVSAAETVSGTVVDGSAAAIAGARVVLRAGKLPSGTGTSNGAGSFALHAEQATYALSFGADDWPQGTLAISDGGVVVPAGGASVAIAYTIGRVAVGGTVVGDDGVTPVANARVTITSQPLANVADVTVGGGAAKHVGGRVARVVTTDQTGALPAMQLPAATYSVIIEPPGPSMDGLTAVTELVAGAATWTLKLDKPVALSGVVTDGSGHGVAGAAVTAVETVGLGAAPTATTDSNGHYTLMVDKGATVDLVVEPVAAAMLAGTRRSLPANAGSANVTLGPGLEVSGIVKAPNAPAPQPGVRIEALCFDCGSPVPVASTISDSQGNYKIYLPDPGEIVLDGGLGD